MHVVRTLLSTLSRSRRQEPAKYRGDPRGEKNVAANEIADEKINKVAVTTGTTPRKMITVLPAANGQIAPVANTIATTIAHVESCGQSTFNALPKNALRSDFATAADTLLKAAACMAAPVASRSAEKTKDSSMQFHRDHSVIRTVPFTEAMEKGTTKIQIKRRFELIGQISPISL
jgi:hypothetical protein